MKRQAHVRFRSRRSFWDNPLKRATYPYKNGEKITDTIDEMTGFLKQEFFKEDMDELFLEQDKLIQAVRNGDNVFK